MVEQGNIFRIILLGAISFSSLYQTIAGISTKQKKEQISKIWKSRPPFESLVWVLYDESSNTEDNIYHKNWAYRLADTLHWKNGPFTSDIQIFSYQLLQREASIGSEIHINGDVRVIDVSEMITASCLPDIDHFFQSPPPASPAMKMLIVIFDNPYELSYCSTFDLVDNHYRNAIASKSSIATTHDWATQTALSLVQYWGDRYHITIQFQFPVNQQYITFNPNLARNRYPRHLQNDDSDFEFFWVHGRGNARLYHAGSIVMPTLPEDDSDQNSPDRYLVRYRFNLRQYTRAGHCFLVVPSSPFVTALLAKSNDISATNFPWMNVSALFLTPAATYQKDSFSSQMFATLEHLNFHENWHFSNWQVLPPDNANNDGEVIWSVSLSPLGKNMTVPHPMNHYDDHVHVLQGEKGILDRWIRTFCRAQLASASSSYPAYCIDYENTMHAYHIQEKKNNSYNVFASQSSLPKHLLQPMIMYYWQRQRDAQANLNSWVLPTLSHELHHPSNSHHTNDNMTSAEETISKDKLYKVISLPTKLAADLKQAFLRSYNDISDNPVVEQTRMEESMVSMVFNQDISPTYHTPLQLSMNNHNVYDSLMWQWLEHVVVNETVTWTNMSMPRHYLVNRNNKNMQHDYDAEGNDARAEYKLSMSDWEITGRYATREYRSGAVVRWHVDPVETQPVTAIVHIAHPFKSNSNINAEDDWVMQVPRTVNGLFSPDTSFLKDQVQEWDDIVLQEGEVLLIQSAKLPHARLRPLSSKVDYYANAFLHLRPPQWKERVDVRILSEF